MSALSWSVQRKDRAEAKLIIRSSHSSKFRSMLVAALYISDESEYVESALVRLARIDSPLDMFASRWEQIRKERLSIAHPPRSLNADIHGSRRNNKLRAEISAAWNNESLEYARDRRNDQRESTNFVRGLDTYILRYFASPFLSHVSSLLPFLIRNYYTCATPACIDC